MRRLGLLCLVLLIVPTLFLASGCENYTESPEINGLFTENALSIVHENRGWPRWLYHGEAV